MKPKNRTFMHFGAVPPIWKEAVAPGRLVVPPATEVAHPGLLRCF